MINERHIESCDSKTADGKIHIESRDSSHQLIHFFHYPIKQNFKKKSIHLEIFGCKLLVQLGNLINHLPYSYTNQVFKMKFQKK